MTVFETIIDVITDQIFLDDNELEHLMQLKLSEASVAEVCDYLRRQDFSDVNIILMDNSTDQIIGSWDSIIEMLHSVNGDILEGTVHDRFICKGSSGDFDELTLMVSHVDFANASKYDPELMWEIAHSDTASIEQTINNNLAVNNTTSVFTEPCPENLLKQYQAIGTLEEFKNLKQRDTATGLASDGVCPRCSSDYEGYAKFCANCGQRLYDR